ncbi:MAG TPA: STAS domain-containing protein [Solirubrobacterales bacterium]|nr:STAS domain-containing protein [Solirubrobacterales bacterium]
MSPQPFSVGSDRVGAVDVIAVTGELDMNTASELQEPLDAALAGPGALLIDLSSCEFIDSTGIALIVRAWQQLGGENGAGQARFALCGLNDQVRRVLELTGLKASIETHPGREEALAALSGPST